MTYKKQTFKKPCDKCGKIFKPESCSGRICEDCKAKIIALAHLERMRLSQNNFLIKYLNYKDKRWYKNLEREKGIIDDSILRLNKELEEK